MNLSKRFIASEKLPGQILGALLQWSPKWFWGFVLITPVMALLALTFKPGSWCYVIELLLLTFGVWLVIKVCSTLTNLFSLKKKDTAITWCQIIILVALGLWIIVFCYRFVSGTEQTVLISVLGVVVGIIFNDKLHGVVAFIHFRMHNLLNIGDLIKVPKYDAFGEVKKVTLTTVSIYNWDTTTSVIPISTLHSDHFINLHSMLEGKTYGRRMRMTFRFDTSWFHTLTRNEIEQIERTHGFNLFLDNEELKDGVLNARAYRIYLFHWLMNHEHISQQPRLIVRWAEQEECGMPLQISAFILESEPAAFEWQQSLVVEHIIESMKWFGLRLYQSPSGYDVGHSDIHLTDQSATYKDLSK